MSTFLRAFGPPVVLTSQLTVGLIIQGTAPFAYTLNHLDAAYPAIGAGASVSSPKKYRYTDFLIEVWRSLRQWIFSAGVAQGFVPVGTVDDVQLILEVTSPDDQNAAFNNATLINIRLVSIGFVGVNITAMFTANNAPASQWGHYLGLYQQSNGSFPFTLSGGAWRLDGQFQPRYLSVVLRSEQDSGEYEERQDYRTVVLGSGQVIPYNFGFAEVRRDLRLVSMDPFVGAPQFHLGSFLSIDVSRQVLSFPNPDTTGAAGSGVLGLGSTPSGLQTDRLRAGDYVRVAEQWIGRVRSVSVPAPGAGAITVTLWESVPANLTLTAGSPVYLIADVHAWILESLRLGGLFVYDVDDITGEWRASGPLYLLRGEGKLLLAFLRQNPQASDRFSFMLNLVRAWLPGLVVVS